MVFDELKWVDFLKKNVKRNRTVTVGIGDDCAVIKHGNTYHLISSDLFVEDVHFQLKSISLKTLGQRAVARAFSDIAACAGRPRFVTISVGVPSYVNSRDLKRIAAGVISVCNEHNASLLGGDTSKSQRLFIDVCVIGKANQPVVRSSAKEGDYIFLTGPLGKLPFHKPFRPKIKEALYLKKNVKVNAMIDISDGFIIDLYRVLRESKKGVLLWAENIPVTNNFGDVYRGEDYELIFTVDKREPHLAQLMKRFPCVGRIKRKAFGHWIQTQGKREKLRIKGFLHF